MLEEDIVAHCQDSNLLEMDSQSAALQARLDIMNLLDVRCTWRLSQERIGESHAYVGINILPPTKHLSAWESDVSFFYGCNLDCVELPVPCPRKPRIQGRGCTMLHITTCEPHLQRHRHRRHRSSTRILAASFVCGVPGRHAKQGQQISASKRDAGFAWVLWRRRLR